jgi:hypothetical protein
VKCDIANYHREIPYAPESMWVTNENKIYGCWRMGNNYSRDNDFHGSYPRSYLKRIMGLFPDNKDILHLFSGMVSSKNVNGTTFDINPKNNPDVLGNAEEVDKYFKENSFDLVLADPPYTKEDAKIYGYKMPVARLVMSNLYKIVKPGGILVWLDIRMPMYRKKEWRELGFITMVISTNHLIRTLCIFERTV